MVRRTGVPVRGAVAMLVVLAATLGGVTAAQAVIGSDEGNTAAYRFAARVQVGAAPGRGCSGALVNRQWVITAKACFTAAGQDPVTGRPAEPATVTVGRTDLATAAGHTLAVTWLVPHPDRDVVLVRLAVPFADVPPVRVATTAPAVGDELRLLGYGRTGAEWVPDHLHGATATVGSVGTATVQVSPVEAGAAAVCKGDAGGPAVRVAGDTVELVGIHHTSGQRGCLDAGGTTADAVETLVTDLAPWIARTAVVACNSYGGVVDQAGYGTAMPDFTGDCVVDSMRQNTTGQLNGWQGTGNVTAGGLLFRGTPALVGSSWQPAIAQRIIVGDFTGDGKTDIIKQNQNAQLAIWASTGVWADGGALFPGPSRTVGAGWDAARIPRILTGDFTGDGRTDIAANYPDGGLRVWPSTGDLSADSRLFVGQGSLHASIGLTVAAYPRLVVSDVNGDGKADLLAQAAGGSLMLYLSSGDASGPGTLFGTQPIPVGAGWTNARMPRIFGGDFTGDGRGDIAAVYSGGELRVWPSTGTMRASQVFVGEGSLSAPGFTTAAYPRILAGDADGDGRLDILAHAADGNLYAWRSTGDGFGPNTLFPGPGLIVGSRWSHTEFQRVF